MNSWLQFIPALLGGLTVLQAGLNRKIAQTWGLSAAVLLNATVLFIFAAVLFVIGLNSKSELLQSHVELNRFSWWYILPGIMGLCLVFGGPWSIHNWGAVHTFLLLVSGQLLFSLWWDFQIEGMPFSWMRLAGCGLAWLGVLITGFSR